MATLELPNAGELNRRIAIAVWSDVPNSMMSLSELTEVSLGRWAKVEPARGIYNRGTAQTGEEATHLFWVRYGKGTEPESITAAHVIEAAGRRYRVLDATDVNDAQTYTLISAKDLGAAK